MSRNSLFPLTVLLCFNSSIAVGAEKIVVGEFSQGDLNGWEEESFVGHSSYQIVDAAHGKVLQAKSQGTASGLFKEITVDLNKTPYLNWSWQVDKTFSGNNEQSKQGDDYPARVYVVVSGGLLFWNTHAINYVWSSNQSVGTAWDNAFTSNAKMIAVRSGATNTGKWLKEKRNVQIDLKRLLGKEVDEIHAVAIMSDSDNTNQSASALYGDIFFSSE